jgi:hypothetical protein
MLLMRILCVSCLAALLASACSGVSDPSKNTNQDFTATVGPGEGRVHEFDSKTGEYSATIIALSPDTKAVFGIYLGQVVNGLCTRIAGQINVAKLNVTALSGAINKDHYCMQVYDPGLEGGVTLPGAETYTLRVSHP